MKKFIFPIIIGLVVLSIGGFNTQSKSSNISLGTRVFTVSQGGTGASTLTGCLEGNGTSAITGTGVPCGSGSSIDQLGQIGDVSTSSPMTYGEVLIYNTATSQWESVATSTLGLGGSGGGTVTSVAQTVPTGFTISGSPVTTSGTLAIGFDTGYFLPTTTRAGTWDTAYSWGNHASAGYLTGVAWGSITGTLSSQTDLQNALNAKLTASSYFSTTTHATITSIPNLSITKSQVSDFGTYENPLTFNSPLSRSGNTISWYGLSTTSQPASSNILVSNGTNGVYGVATSTLSVTSPLTGSFTQIGSGGSLGCQTASGSQAGCLSSTDWTTFNGKESALTFTYPLVRTTNTISTALTTTTAHTWSQLQTFSSGINVGGTTFTSLIPTTRALTIAGTANQITSSAGSQNLTADRTWTLSLPNHVIFPSSFFATNASTTNATTTSLNATNSYLSSIFGGNNSLALDISGTNRYLVDTTGVNSIDWDTRLLLDTTATNSIDWSNRYLIDSTGSQALGYGTAGTLVLDGYNCSANTNNGKLTVNASGEIVCADDISSSGSGAGTISTSTNPTIGHIPYWTHVDKLGSVATGTVSSSGGITTTADRSVIGGALAISCDVASGSQAGCLSSTNWTTFNNKESALSFTWPLIRSTNTISWGGLSTTTNLTTGHIPFVSGANTFSSVATGTISVPTGLTATANRYVIGGNLTLGLDTGYVIPLQSTLDAKLATLGSGYASTTQANIAFSTSTTAFNGLTFGQTIVPSAGALTFKPTITGTLDNAGLTNSTISGVALGGTLANLTATDSTLTFSGTYTGATARTIGLNLGNANTWTAKQTFGYASSTGFSTSYASSTLYYGAGLSTCDATTGKLTWANGVFGCGTDFNTGGGGGDPAWATTSPFTNQLVLYPQDQDNTDVVFGRSSGSTTTAPFWFDVSATTTYIGNGGTGGDSFVTLGANSNEWTLGYDETDKSFAIASSTTLGTNNVLTIAKGGASTTTVSALTISNAVSILGEYFTNFTTYVRSIIASASLVVTGAWDFGGATSLEIPNGTGPTTDAIGEIAWDTSDNQLLIATTTANTPVVYPSIQRIWSATVASTTLDFASGGRLPLPPQRDGFVIKEIHCFVDGGTSKVINLDTLAGGANTDSLTCATTLTSDTAMSANYTVSAGALWALEMGATTGAVDYVTFSVWGVWTRE